MRVEWTRAASEDLEAIAAYIAMDRPGAAAKQVLTVIQAVEDLLPAHPGFGRGGRVPGTRELVVARTPFVVAYRALGDAIQVLRVLHGARRWPERI